MLRAPPALPTFLALRFRALRFVALPFLALSSSGFAFGCGAPGTAGASVVRPPSGTPAPSSTAPTLRAPETFVSAFPEPAARSRALFLEAARVLLHPRCANCHPVGDSPFQGDAFHVHDPPVSRGSGDEGVAGMECASCHQDRNVELARVPGAPGWHLAPREMGWVGRSPRQICEQMKDPKRNGGRTLARIVDHSAHDALVAWGWSPGADRTPAPGSQAEFGRIVQAWVDTGAECPEEEATR